MKECPYRICRPSGGQAPTQQVPRLRASTTHVLAFQSAVVFLPVSLLFVSGADLSPEYIPRNRFLGTLSASGAPFWVPLGSPSALFGALGHLLVSPWTPFRTRTKKETKSDMEDPRSGVQVGTQNRHFSGKSGNKHEKMGSQTGSGKRVLS